MVQAICGQCGEVMTPGRVAPTGVDFSDGQQPQLSFVVGSPTSWNPLKAFLQGLRETGQEALPIRGRVCIRCGRFEFFLDPADLGKATRLAGPAARE
jgi:hypothetical protein